MLLRQDFYYHQHFGPHSVGFAPMKERDAALIKFIREGHTFSEASRAFEISRQRVHQIASREQVQATRPPVKKDHILAIYHGQGVKKAAQIAQIVGCDDGYVREVLARDKADPGEDVPAGISLATG